MSTAPSIQTKRIELILQQLEVLPTLSSIAVRLIEITSNEDSDARDVIKVVAADSALTSKVLKLCRCLAGGRARRVTTIEGAVVMVGFEAVRSAALSVQVFETFDGIRSVGDEVAPAEAVFDRDLFWRHSLAVAVASEALADLTRGEGKVNRGEAYLAGLLHDLGLLALHLVVPQSFDRVCELAESYHLSIDRSCRRVIGVDGRIAGRRLAEHWQLPQFVVDSIWLHGQEASALPDVPHRRLIGLITLADAMVRRRYIAPAGHTPHDEDVAAMCSELGLKYADAEHIASKLHDEVVERATAIGMPAEVTTEALLRSISRANEVLSRITTTMRRKTSGVERAATLLGAMNDLHNDREARTTEQTLQCITASAKRVFGNAVTTALLQVAADEPLQVFDVPEEDHELVARPWLEQPAGAPSLAALVDDDEPFVRFVDAASCLPDAGASLGAGRDALLLMLGGGGAAAALLIDNATNLRIDDLAPVIGAWREALASTVRHQQAVRLSEQLAAANRDLAETRNTAAKTQAMASLGELAAGAAHEMNNPLTVIAGRAQVLLDRVDDPELKVIAGQLSDQAVRLSEMISALRTVASPADPKPQECDLRQLVDQALAQCSPKNLPDIEVLVAPRLPSAWIDPDQMIQVIAELIRNAAEAEGTARIRVDVQIDPSDDRLMIEVTDDGPGFSGSALSHAFAPFFSEKPAGRRPGLGLARARRLVEANRGRITLNNSACGGAVAQVALADWRLPTTDLRDVA